MILGLGVTSDVLFDCFVYTGYAAPPYSAGISAGDLNLQDWKMTDDHKSSRWKMTDGTKRTKNERLTLTDRNLQDWKMTEKLTIAYKAGGKCEFWTQIYMHITTTYSTFWCFLT